jgi:hypothetical protein
MLLVPAIVVRSINIAVARTPDAIPALKNPLSPNYASWGQTLMALSGCNDCEGDI